MHSRADQWVLWEGQREFLEALRRRSRDPGRIEELVFDRTGATFEHLGFGHAANEVRLTEIDFLDRALRAGQA